MTEPVQPPQSEPKKPTWWERIDEWFRRRFKKSKPGATGA